jgi:RimJ/RimL family protein N-acetyltransferase
MIRKDDFIIEKQELFFNQEIILENHRVRLVPFSEEYRNELEEIIFDDGMEFSLCCKTTEDLENYIAKTIKQRESQNGYPFIVIDNETDKVAGSTRYGNIIFQNKRLEIGWTWYGKKFRGSGLNKACKFELLKYAFEVMKFRRVQFSADIENIRSQKAIIKLGAQREGIFRANYINDEGQSRDDVYFSIVYTEWNKMKETIFKEFISE